MKNNGLDYYKGHLEVGYDVNIVVFHPIYEEIFTNEGSLQGVDYCAFEGLKKKGKVESVLLKRNLTVDNIKFIGEKSRGQLVKGKPYGLMYRYISFSVTIGILNTMGGLNRPILNFSL